jgi:flagellin
MRINNNLMALNAHRYMSSANSKQSKSLEKLSSGLAINSAADNAAGLAISEKMRAQINGLEQAQSNAQDGISMIQTAEGALQESENILQRMRELAVQSANDTNTAEDRSEIQKEIDQLASEITRISESTEFNTKKLLDGSLTGKLHIGANEGQDLEVAINGMDAETLGVSGSDGIKINVTASSTLTSQDADGAAGNTDAAENFGALGTTGGEYTAVQLDTSFSVDDASTSFTANYGLADSDGNIVAVSTDGNTYTVLTTATAQEDLSATTSVFDNGTSDMTIAFGTNTTVTSGTVTTTLTANDGGNAADTLAVTADTGVLSFTGSTDLDSGTYTVVDSTHPMVTNLGLMDSNGEIVALDGGSGDTFSDLLGNEIFNIANAADALVAGDTIEVASSGGIDVSTQSAASDAITTLNTAINDVSAERANLGAIQNRLDHTINNLSTTAENMTASESRIRDVDMAKEMMEYTKLGILQQASQAMLAQANQAPQGVLQLLQ